MASLEEIENTPYVQGLKNAIRTMDAELTNARADLAKWKSEANRWFELYTGTEVFKKLEIVADENLRLKDENRGLQRSNSKLQEQVALLQAEFKKTPGDAKG